MATKNRKLSFVLSNEPTPLRLRALLPVIFICLAAVGVAQAQSTATQVPACQVDTHASQAHLSGVVSDPSGAAIVGATISLRCGSFRQETHSTGDGTYSIDVPAATYQVQVEASGFEVSTQTTELIGGTSKKLDVALPIGHAASIVTVTAPRGYVATSATTATKTDTALIETPQSVSVITLDQITSRNTQGLGEAIRYTSGVGVDTFGTETRFDWFNIRGFDESTYGLFRDNSRWQSGQVEGQVDPYELQEIDVIKGPSSVLYGQNTPGGLVNLVTKRPSAEPSGEIMLNFGSYDRKQVQADIGGPIDANAHFRYRVLGLFRDSDTQVNFVPDNRRLIAPSFTWAPSSNTTLTILTDYQRDNTGWSQFLPSQGVLTPNPNGSIPTSLFVGEPGYDYFHRKQWSAAYLFEHRFNSIWTFRQTSRYSKITYHGKTVFGGGFTPPDLKDLNRFGFGNLLSLGLYTLDTQAMAQVKTGSVQHSFLFGVDYSHADAVTVSGFSFAAPLDVFAPVYGQPVPDLFIYQNTDQNSMQTGVYVQDNIKIAKKLVTTLSGRGDFTKSITHDRLFSANTPQSPAKFTGRAGITYLSDIGLAPYFSYSTSFLPTIGTSFSGSPFEPTTGEQYEAGVKYQPRGVESFITASLFRVTQDNVLSPDPSHVFNQVQDGSIRSRGIEVEGVASILHGLNVHAAYSYIDEAYTKNSDASLIGKRPVQFPDQLFSLSLDETVTKGPLTGLGGNFGVRFVGTTAGDPANSIIVPTYTLVDASVRYDYKRLRFQINTTNLADKTYVAVCQSVSYCNYGYRRNVIGSIRYRWSSWHDMF